MSDKTRWFTTKTGKVWHALTGDRAMCRSNIRPYGDTYPDTSQCADFAACTACERKLAERDAALAESSKARKCGTVGCKLEATHTLTYSFPESRGETETCDVCEFCGEGYTRRPTLRASLVLLTSAPGHGSLLSGGIMKTATPKDTADLIMGAGATACDWYRGSDNSHVWDGTNAYDDWHVTLLMDHPDDPNTEPPVRADLSHAVVMKWARYVLANKGKMLRTPAGGEYRAWSEALERECKNLIFDAEWSDFDASSADELIQLAAYGEVVFG